MKITNAEAYQYFQALQDAKEAGMLGFAIAKNMRKLAGELVEYEQKRSELLQKHGEDIGNGKFQLTGEHVLQYLAEMKPFDELAFEFEPMTVSEEVFCGGSLTSDQMYNLFWMVSE